MGEGHGCRLRTKSCHCTTACPQEQALQIQTPSIPHPSEEAWSLPQCTQQPTSSFVRMETRTEIQKLISKDQGQTSRTGMTHIALSSHSTGCALKNARSSLGTGAVLVVFVHISLRGCSQSLRFLLSQTRAEEIHSIWWNGGGERNGGGLP